MKIFLSSILLPGVTLIPSQSALAEQAPGTGLIPQNAPAAPPTQIPADINDIYGPLLLPDPINWLPFIIAAALLLVASALLFIFLKKRKNAVIPEIPAHTAALAELEQAREFLISNRSLIYAERLSKILRRYIERRFRIGSTRQTTTEFFHCIDEATDTIASELQPYSDDLIKCMQQCDMAKFAHKTADRGSMEEMEDGVRRFIDSTTPQEDTI